MTAVHRDINCHWPHGGVDWVSIRNLKAGEPYSVGEMPLHKVRGGRYADSAGEEET